MTTETQIETFDYAEAMRRVDARKWVARLAWPKWRHVYWAGYRAVMPFSPSMFTLRPMSYAPSVEDLASTDWCEIR